MDLYGREAVFKMKKRKGLLPGWLVPLAFVALCGYLFFLLIQYQVSIASKQQELQSLQDQLTAQETTNAELSSTLDQGDSAIIERYAREQGYVRPNERVFVNPELRGAGAVPFRRAAIPPARNGASGASRRARRRGNARTAPAARHSPLRSGYGGGNGARFRNRKYRPCR